jgi:RimJ/RimL family protein N-acetyltransferase
MVSMQHCSQLSELNHLKAAYLRGLAAPMDGMWDAGFVPQAQHWEIKMRDEQAGYCAVTDEGALLQFFLLPAFEVHGPAIFEHVVSQDVVHKAVASTIDPLFLSLCLDVQKQVTVHTYMYEVRPEAEPHDSLTSGLEFSPVDETDLDRTVDFQRSCLGKDQDLSEWLRAYSGNLLGRRELFVLHRDDEWVGLGECRKSDSQAGVADLGMMVGPEHRRRGWGTVILRRLKAHGAASGLRLICSTTVDNSAAQKAILRAGFVSHHRIMDITL